MRSTMEDKIENKLAIAISATVNTFLNEHKIDNRKLSLALLINLCSPMMKAGICEEQYEAFITVMNILMRKILYSNEYGR